MRRRLFLGASFALALAAAAANPGAAQAQSQLRVAVSSTLAQIDPALTTIGDEYIYAHLVYNGLTRIDHDLKVHPDLAVSWEASPDLKVWTFKLRPGVKFHHGRVMDADDVVYTFQRILNPATGSRARSNLNMVEKVEAVDASTVRFTLNMTYAGFSDLFGERQFKILPRDRADKHVTEPVGTGPYRMRSWSPGDRMELVRNTDYFEPGLPKTDNITIRIIPEAAARIAALETGAIDILWNLPYESIQRFQNHSNVRVDSIATATWDGIILNNERPPFNDVRVRQALSLTIDRQALIELALFGQGAPTHSPIPPTHAYFAKDLAVPTPNVARARQLLAEAGLPNGFEVTMQVPQEREPRVRLGVAVRDMARAAGIRINIERVPFATYAANVAGKAQMYVDGYFARPTLDTALYPFYHSSGSWNRQLWLFKDARVDAILDESRRTNDEAVRGRLFREMQARLNETVPGIIAYNALHVNGVRREVEGFRSSAMQWLELKEVTVRPRS